MSKSKIESADAVADRDLYSGLIRLHVHHHAVEGPIFGLNLEIGWSAGRPMKSERARKYR